MWVPETIDHDIIQLLDGDIMMQLSWHHLDNCNEYCEKCFTAKEIVESSKPVSLLYTPGF